MSLSLADQLAILRQGDPPATTAGLFGYDYPLAEANLVIFPMPWEPTASYGKGTASAPHEIVAVSHQLDLWDRFYGAVYEKGIAYDIDFSREIGYLGKQADQALAAGDKAAVTAIGEKVNSNLRQRAAACLARGQKVAVFGGDHSCPLGLIEALAEKKSFGILHIDAHHDLRDSYEGYRYSHASVMHNALSDIAADKLTTLVSIGIRDYAFTEYDFARQQGDRVRTFYWEDIATRLARGETFDSLSRDVIEALPENVYISLDIDGLNYAYSAATGTPVPGGFSFDQVLYLLKALNEAGKSIAGFDLCETGTTIGDEWSLNVAARLLYRLAGVTLYGTAAKADNT